MGPIRQFRCLASYDESEMSCAGCRWYSEVLDMLQQFLAHVARRDIALRCAESAWLTPQHCLAFCDESPTALRCVQMVIKCADIGHLAADYKTHQQWSYKLEEEFFRQVSRPPTCQRFLAQLHVPHFGDVSPGLPLPHARDALHHQLQTYIGKSAPSGGVQPLCNSAIDKKYI